MAKWHLLLMLLVAAVAVAAASEYCERKNGCECEFSDGSRIDLSALFQRYQNNDTVYLSDTLGNFTVFYHGCVDVVFQLSYVNISGDHCRNPAVICEFDSESRNLTTLGVSASGMFIMEQDVHVLSYDGNGVTTKVELICTPQFDAAVKVTNISADGTKFTLQLFSRHACRTVLPHVLSIGTKLLMILFTIPLVYFVGGMLTRAHFTSGARGRELIPNVDFWTSLPGLVKDGAVFLISGCSTRLVTTAETYDQI